MTAKIIPAKTPINEMPEEVQRELRRRLAIIYRMALDAAKRVETNENQGLSVEAPIAHEQESK